jgi:hypothetical protein
MAQNQTQLIRGIILSAIVVLVAALGSLVYAETATVKLSVPPQKLGATATLSGSQTGGDLKTQHIDATATKSLDGTAMTVFIEPKFATGQVVFKYTCKSGNCQTRPIGVPAGTLVTSASLLGYATQANATLQSPTWTATVAVRATSPGTAWNTAKNTITAINDNATPDLHVSNPAAIIGGTDGRSAQVIQQSDWDAVLNQLTPMVADALDLALKATAPDMSFINNGPPLMTVTSNHRIGDLTSTFTITMTGRVGATAFSNAEAVRLIRSALDAKIPAGQQLTNDSVEITWQILQTSPNGDITVSGSALGFIAPKVSTDTLRAHIRGLSPTQARKSLEQTVPGSAVEIHVSPGILPWLPLIAEHIKLTVVVLPAFG